MIGPAVALGQLTMAHLPDALQADIRQVGELARDFGDLSQPRQVARPDAQHLALLELRASVPEPARNRPQSATVSASRRPRCEDPVSAAGA